MTIIAHETLVEARANGAPWLHRVHPLAKLATVLPMIAALFFVRDLATPLIVAVAAFVLLVTGTRLPKRLLAAIAIIAPLTVLILSITLGLWADRDLVAQTPILATIGPWPLYLGGWLVGLETGMRLLAIALLALLAGSSIAATDFVRSLVQHLRVPYRIGYAALASFRFVPRFRRELETIRRAHRVRGIGGRGPLGWLRGQIASIVPLLAAALRHADRVAIAMEARAFGYAPHRTERHRVPVRASDIAVVIVGYGLTAAVLLIAPLWHDAVTAWVADLLVR